MQIEVNGINLHYQKKGEGQTLLFLHGNQENLHIFDRSVDFFSRNFCCYALDSRAHGQSEVGDQKLTIPLLASDVVAFIDKLQLDNVTIIGFSDGGNIALEVAALIPQKIKNLITVGANLYPKGMKFSVRLSIKLTEIILSLFFFNNNCKILKQKLQLMSKQPEITNAKLSKITANTLIVAGENDMIKQKHTELIHSQINNSKLIIIKNTNHFIFKNNNKKISELIMDFIK